MLGEIVVSQEWYCKRNVGLGRCQISVVKGFVDNVRGSGTTWLFEIGGLSGGWDVVLKLLELCTAVVFSVWYADGGGAHIIVAMFMVAPLWCDGVEVEFDVNRVGGEKVVVVVSVRKHLEVS